MTTKLDQDDWNEEANLKFRKLDSRAAQWHWAECASEQDRRRADFIEAYKIEFLRYQSIHGSKLSSKIAPPMYNCERAHYEDILVVRGFAGVDGADSGDQGLRLACVWFDPQWMEVDNTRANISFFILSAIFAATKNLESYQYAHRLCLEADKTRFPAGSGSKTIDANGGFKDAIDSKRIVKDVSDYTIPENFPWQAQIGTYTVSPEGEELWVFHRYLFASFDDTHGDSGNQGTSTIPVCMDKSDLGKDDDKVNKGDPYDRQGVSPSDDTSAQELIKKTKIWDFIHCKDLVNFDMDTQKWSTTDQKCSVAVAQVDKEGKWGPNNDGYAQGYSSTWKDVADESDELAAYGNKWHYYHSERFTSDTPLSEWPVDTPEEAQEAQADLPINTDLFQSYAFTMYEKDSNPFVFDMFANVQNSVAVTKTTTHDNIKADRNPSISAADAANGKGYGPQGDKAWLNQFGQRFPGLKGRDIETEQAQIAREAEEMFSRIIDNNAHTRRMEPIQWSYHYEEVQKHDFALLYLEARCRSQRGLDALDRLVKLEKAGIKAYGHPAKAYSNLSDDKRKTAAAGDWAAEALEWLKEEGINYDGTYNKNHHEEPILVGSDLKLVWRYGKSGAYPAMIKGLFATNKKSSGTANRDLNQSQRGHWMMLGRFPGVVVDSKDSTAVKDAKLIEENFGEIYWIMSKEAPRGASMVWVPDGKGNVVNCWVSDAKDEIAEQTRALAEGRPPYFLASKLDAAIPMGADDKEHPRETKKDEKALFDVGPLPVFVKDETTGQYVKTESKTFKDSGEYYPSLFPPTGSTSVIGQGNPTMRGTVAPTVAAPTVAAAAAPAAAAESGDYSDYSDYSDAYGYSDYGYSDDYSDAYSDYSY